MNVFGMYMPPQPIPKHPFSKTDPPFPAPRSPAPAPARRRRALHRKMRSKRSSSTRELQRKCCCEQLRQDKCDGVNAAPAWERRRIS